MKIVIGCDYAGFELKGKIINHLSEKGFDVEDMGCYSEDSIDYADYAHPVAFKVEDNSEVKGILICGSGIGVSIAANRFKKIRAAVCYNQISASLARKHNNANVLCLGARLIHFKNAQKIINTFITTKFEGGRHTARVKKLDK